MYVYIKMVEFDFLKLVNVSKKTVLIPHPTLKFWNFWMCRNVRLNLQLGEPIKFGKFYRQFITFYHSFLRLYLPKNYRKFITFYNSFPRSHRFGKGMHHLICKSLSVLLAIFKLTIARKLGHIKNMLGCVKNYSW